MAHTLKADGAAFDQFGARIQEGTTSGTGSAFCSCGWVSDELPTRVARKAAHADHKLEAVPARLVADDVHEISSDPVVRQIVEKMYGDPELPFDEGGVLPLEPASVSVSVPYSGAAKHFFEALVQDGTVALADRMLIDLEVFPKEQAVSVSAPTSAEAHLLAVALGDLWAAANLALRAWKKSDPVYRAYHKAIPAQQEAASRDERTFLRDWCATPEAAAILGAARP